MNTSRLSTEQTVKQELIDLSKDWISVGSNARKVKDLEKIVEAANEAGWDGVENSKILAEFIRGLGKERDDLVKQVARLKAAAKPKKKP